MARSKNNPRDVLLHDTNYSSISKDQKKAKKYFGSLPKIEQDKLIKQFENEKLQSSFMQKLYQEKGLNSPLFSVLFDNYIVVEKFKKQS